MDINGLLDITRMNSTQYCRLYARITCTHWTLLRDTHRTHTRRRTHTHVTFQVIKLLTNWKFDDIHFCCCHTRHEAFTFQHGLWKASEVHTSLCISDFRWQQHVNCLFVCLSVWQTIYRFYRHSVMHSLNFTMTYDLDR